MAAMNNGETIRDIRMNGDHLSVVPQIMMQDYHINEIMAGLYGGYK